MALKIDHIYSTSLCFVVQLFCMGCKSKQARERDNVQINVATNSLHEVVIDDQHIKLTDSIQTRKMDVGQHSIKIQDTTIVVDVVAREQVLVNTSLDTVIMEEVLYNMVYNGLASDVTQHYQSPITVFSLGSLKYAGPYKLFINEPIIKGWDFFLGQKPFSYLDWDNPEYKGSLTSNYYKINTTSEFRATKVPLNYINEWIEPRVLANVISLEQGYKLTVEQGNFLIVGSSKENKISVCKVGTDINDDVVIREVTWYNKEEHGKIIRTIAMLGNCILQEDTIKKKRKLEIVFSDNTHQPHLRIVQ